MGNFRDDFYNARVFDAYEYFGAHTYFGGVKFSVFAPAAAKVAVIGDFSGWQPWMMNGDNGFWELYANGAKAGDMYKIVIYTRSGERHEHCDPYGFGMELRPNWASVVRDLDTYKFTDGEWMSSRDKNYNKPLNIYELHLGSWKKKPAESDNDNDDAESGWYNYSEIADLLIPYLKDHSFTHVELMPISEHPADISWGYQNTGFYAPTSRYGTPEQLMELIDRLHNAGIGAIMDFVPVHFALDDYALRSFDGTPLYEYPESDVSVSEWGTCNFQFNKPWVASFMQSCADFWLTKYHFDGLRMDAISRAIYWMGDPARGVNPNSVNFIKAMNGGLQQRHGDCMLIAEDSTSFPKITAPIEYGGLGFDYKWDLGWMNDTLNYFRTPPAERPREHYKLTFSMQYFYNELYLLELSHDENVHGKATIVNKMWGDYDVKFPQARAMYAYMFTHPGKKLNFMGGEFAQFREWDETREQDWDILKYPLHESFNRYFKALSALYVTHPALHNAEYNSATFRWLMADNTEQSVYVYLRSAENRTVLCAFNFSDKEQSVRINMPSPSHLTPLLDSDEQTYSGSTPSSEIKPIDTFRHIDGEILKLTLPAFCAQLFEVEPREDENS